MTECKKAEGIAGLDQKSVVNFEIKLKLKRTKKKTQNLNYYSFESLNILYL